MVFLKLSLLPYIPHIFFLNHNDLYRPILPEFVEVIKATDLRLLKQSELVLSAIVGFWPVFVIHMTLVIRDC